MTADLHRSTIDKRVDGIMPSLEHIANVENTPLLQLLLIVMVKICRRLGLQALAKLLYTVFISRTDIASHCEMGIEKCTYIMVSQELGRNRYSDLRHTLMSEGCEVQAWHRVNGHCESITPERIPVVINPNGAHIGYRYRFKDVCIYFINRALLAASITGATVPDKLFIGGKDGTDGSGQHYRRATVHVAVNGNIILYSFTPLVICKGDNAEGEVVWRNPAPNSPLTQRPLAVIGAKEEREDVLRPFIPQVETEIVDVSRDGINMQYMGTDIHVSVHSSLTMFDGKMHATLQGTGGAYCQLCKHSKETCHNPDHAAAGFTVDRTIADMHDIFSVLTNDGELPLIKRQGDYDTRAGVTAKPITTRDLNTGISVTHAWLNCAKWLLNVLYHLAANDRTWGFGNKADTRYSKLMKAKAKVQDTFQSVLGRRIDTADATGHTGSSLTGNLAKRFFDKECRTLLAKFVKKPQLNAITKVHLNLHVILRVVSSKDSKIDLDNFANLCSSTYINILANFKWVELTPSVHKVLAHYAELIDKNMCMGIGHLSEEGLEACHKIIRRFRASWTLQSSDHANLKDLIKKLWLVSDPYFYSLRRTIKCPKYGSAGHQRKCPIVENASNQSESDGIFEEMFVN